MHNQPKFIPQRGTAFFADGRSSRPQVENTVARNEVNVDDYFHTGLLNGKEQDALPFPVTAQVLARGQERYNIYCTPCHSRVGNGAGMIVQRGYKPAGNFHDAKRLAEPLSHYFYVMSNGYGAMPDYSAQLVPADRWAVAAYIRALQLSQNATSKDLPAGAQVENLTDVAVREGYPADFAGPWELPSATNVQAISPGEAPAAMAPAQPTNPAVQSHPPVKTPAATATKAPAASGN
jgi:mono/diheme cytochrome c family protein